MTDDIVLIKAPKVCDTAFWTGVFDAARQSGAQVVVVAGNVKVYKAEGAEARINIIDRLFGWNPR